MRQSLLLLAAAATASAQTRITNWEEQHQRFVRQAAFVGDLLLALRGDEVLFVREVDGPADVTVVAS